MRLKSVMTTLIVMTVILLSFITVHAVTVTEEYVNMQFATSDSYKTNSADSSTAIAFDNFSGSAKYSFEEILNSGTSKFTMPANVATTDRTRYIGQSGFMSAKVTGLDSRVTWYELSFRFEKYVSGITLRVDKPIFCITDSGDIYLDPYADGHSGEAKVTNAACVTDKWYHLVIAYDYLDATLDANSVKRPKIYAYLNGELLTASTATDYSLYGSSRTCVTEFDRIRLEARTSSQGEAVKYLDNFKIYTSSVSVAQEISAGTFDPTDIYDGAQITSEHFKIAGNTIYVPADETLGTVAALTKSGEKGAAYYKDGIISLEDAVVTSAAGGKILARADNGIGIKEYTIAEGKRLYDTNGAIWSKTEDAVITDETVFTGISSPADIEAGDTIKATVNMVNDTSQAQSSVLILAVYNGSALADCVMTNITVPTDGAAVSTGNITVEDDTDLSVRVFVWKSMTDRTPVMTGLVLEEIVDAEAS